MMKTVALTTYYGDLPSLRHNTSRVNKEGIDALVLTENRTYSIADEFPDLMTQYLHELSECHV